MTLLTIADGLCTEHRYTGRTSQIEAFFISAFTHSSITSSYTQCLLFTIKPEERRNEYRIIIIIIKEM